MIPLAFDRTTGGYLSGSSFATVVRIGMGDRFVLSVCVILQLYTVKFCAYMLVLSLESDILKDGGMK